MLLRILKTNLIVFQKRSGLLHFLFCWEGQSARLYCRNAAGKRLSWDGLRGPGMWTCSDELCDLETSVLWVFRACGPLREVHSHMAYHTMNGVRSMRNIIIMSLFVDMPWHAVLCLFREAKGDIWKRGRGDWFVDVDGVRYLLVIWICSYMSKTAENNKQT